MNKKYIKTKNKMKYNRYVAVGELKYKLLKKIGKCENCGYDQFLEILELAHVIHGHEPEKVNSGNCFLLCPNCHRAFDRGLLEIHGEVSDCHLVKYKSPFVLFKAKQKAMRLKSKTDFIWKSTGDGKFFTTSKPKE